MFIKSRQRFMYLCHLSYFVNRGGEMNNEYYYLNLNATVIN